MLESRSCRKTQSTNSTEAEGNLPADQVDMPCFFNWLVYARELVYKICDNQ